MMLPLNMQDLSRYRSRIFWALTILGCLPCALAHAEDTSDREEQLPPLIHAHAHNDYEHTHPLFDALGHGFASVEADIHLVDGQLLVAHDRSQVKPERTLQALYLDPLRARARKFGGRIYPHGDPTFFLLIDTKSDANETYAVLRKVLEDYPELITKFDHDKVERKAVTVVLTGNRPRSVLPNEPVRLAGLDGQMPDLDNPNPNGIFLWMSDDWKDFFKWDGNGPFPVEEKVRLRDIVAKAHARHMKVRFWDAPDSVSFWRELRSDGVDLINADDLAGLEKFLRQRPGRY
jgi:glycerophosphoryl diester phosphodiesterase